MGGQQGRRKIGDAAVAARTGRDFSQWLAALDGAGGARMSHQEIALHLIESYGLPPWWAQMIAVRYEQERGLREAGQAADGWQGSAQRSISAPAARVWAILTRPRTRERWLGPVTRMRLTPGSRYVLGDGTTGQVRAVRKEHLLRLTWDAGGGRPSTLEITLTPRADGGTVVRFRHHRIARKRDRDALIRRWRSAVLVLAELGDGLASGDKSGRARPPS